ncbi:SRPBCC family protein [Auritidibacter ignavus]|uniref:SRPBCC family protein n=1 Tax=Auritidibacter ignavus TaxID=678932 RepID=A0AAJ6DBN1_9MICC|nr:SRPBCC family protein [Auritidibacter ignavus]WGH92805.1 SRPBCC family protein [Auritidibacter ignavus]
MNDSSSRPINPDTGLPQTAPQAGWPTALDAGPKVISYRVNVKASPEALWEILADPHRHHEIDGSDTVKPKVSGPHQLTVGDTFKVAMHKFGIDYTMKLTTVAAIPGEIVEWKHPAGHTWRWELAADAHHPGYTTVTESFDYSSVPFLVAMAYYFSNTVAFNAQGIQASLTRLAGRYL